MNGAAQSATNPGEQRISAEEKDFILRFLGLEAGERFSVQGESGVEAYFLDDQGHVYRISQSESGERLETADTDLWKLLHSRDKVVKDRTRKEERIKLFQLLHSRFGCSHIIREGALLFAGAAATEKAPPENTTLTIGRRARSGLEKLLDSSPDDRAAAIAALIRAAHRDSKLVLLLSPEQINRGAWGLQDGAEINIQEEIEQWSRERR